MIAVIGAGVMGEAILGGLIRSGEDPARLVIAERRADRAAQVAGQYGVRAIDLAAAARDAATLLLVVKPQDLPALLGEVGAAITSDTLVVSLAAGVRTDTIESALHPGTPVVRAMPNTPAVVDRGVTAISAGRFCTERHLDYTASLLGAVGRVVIVPEDLQDAVTAVSGSGPAYVFAMIEALTDAAVAVGLAPDTARTLVTETVLGAGLMAAREGADAATLRQQVTSPGGTTQAALASLDADGFRDIIRAAVIAARDRSRELGRVEGAP